jgi:indole-3-glycerol phosphate synthase
MSQAPNILQTIFQAKKEEVKARKQYLPLKKLKEQLFFTSPARGFKAALHQRAATGQAAVIAEIKRASPSKGLLRDPFNPAQIAQSYAQHGATALSVLTETQFFQGDDRHLQTASAACSLPILRKDFIIDAYQIYEARVLEADAILLIVAGLTDKKLLTFYELAQELTLDVLVEVHDAAELERAQKLPDCLIGINNRDLRTFDVSLQTTLDLRAQLPADQFVITESGIQTPADVDQMMAHQIQGFLVGETFMRAPDPGLQLQTVFAHHITP